MRKFIVFHGARCGTGQSTLVANVALRLLLSGKRVAVIDADLYAPGQHVLFGWQRLPNKKVLNDFLKGEASLREVAHDLTDRVRISFGLSQEISGVLYLVPADQSLDAIREVWDVGYDLEQLYHNLPKLIDGLVLDYILVDTHPGLDPNSILIAAAADLLYLVSSTDAQCMDSTEYLLVALRRQGESPSFLVFDKNQDTNHGQDLKRSIKQRFDLETAAILPIDTDIALQADRPPLLRHPSGPWQRGIDTLAAHLIDNSQLPSWGGNLEEGYK